MTNSEIIGLLAPAFLDILDDEALLDPFDDFPLPVELIPISSETQQQWIDDDGPPDGRLAVKFARFVADILAPNVE